MKTLLYILAGVALSIMLTGCSSAFSLPNLGLGSGETTPPDSPLADIQAINSWMYALMIGLFVGGVILIGVRLSAIGGAMILGSICGIVLLLALVKYATIIAIAGGILLVGTLALILYRTFIMKKNETNQQVAIKELVATGEVLKGSIPLKTSNLTTQINNIQSKATKKFVQNEKEK